MTDHIRVAPFEEVYPDAAAAQVVSLNSTNGHQQNRGSHATTTEPVAAIPILRRVSDVQPERVKWLWKGRVPLGKITVIDGDPDLGKSTMLTDLTARITTGSPMPDGSPGVGPAGVVMLTAEDGIADTVRPRLDAHGADTTRVHVLEGVLDLDGVMQLPSLPGHVDILRDAIRDCGAVLLTVDPFMAYLHGSIKSYSDQDVRRAMHPLKLLAEEMGVAVGLVRHLNKATGTSAIYRGGGSIGIVGAARAGLLVARDPGDETRRILAVAKCNLGAHPPALAYRLIGDDLHGCARITWEGATNHTPEGLLAAPESDEDRSALAEAADFLEDALATGPMLAKTVKAQAKDAGIAERTLDRAKKRAGVKSKKDGADGPWLWTLPAQDRQAPNGGDVGSLGNVGDLGLIEATFPGTKDANA